MTRVKRGSKSTKKVKIMRLSKGYKGSSSKLWRSAKQRVNRALANAFVGRRLKKRLYRRLWIKRISSSLTNMNLQINYSQFISHLKSQDIQINRKIISQIAIYDRVAFEQIINQTLVTEVV